MGKDRRQADPAPAPEVVMVFPIVGRGPREWPLDKAKLAEYAASYPGVDVLAECRKALQWCRDNPAKRKTSIGMPRFLNSWLSKEQNSAASRPRPSARTFSPSDNFGQGRTVVVK